jgi:hypothetical protein
MEEHALERFQRQGAVVPHQAIAADAVEIEVVHVRAQGRHRRVPDRIQCHVAGLEAAQRGRRVHLRVEADVGDLGIALDLEPRITQRALRQGDLLEEFWIRVPHFGYRFTDLHPQLAAAPHREAQRAQFDFAEVEQHVFPVRQRHTASGEALRWQGRGNRQPDHALLRRVGEVGEVTAIRNLGRHPVLAVEAGLPALAGRKFASFHEQARQAAGKVDLHVDARAAGLEYPLLLGDVQAGRAQPHTDAADRPCPGRGNVCRCRAALAKVRRRQGLAEIGRIADVDAALGRQMNQPCLAISRQLARIPDPPCAQRRLYCRSRGARCACRGGRK